MNKNSVTFGILGLLAGLAIGFFGANSMNRNSASNTTESGAPVLGSPQAPQTKPQTNQGGMLADVQATLDKAKNEPDNFEAQIKAGEMYSKIRRFDKALEFYEAAQKLKPDDFSANSILGNAYFDLKEYEKAGAAYSKALEINPKDVAVRTDYGLTFYLREPADNQRAISEYRKSLEIEPRHEKTLQNLIVVLNDEGEKDEISKAVVILKQVNPNNPAVEKFAAGSEK